MSRNLKVPCMTLDDVLQELIQILGCKNDGTIYWEQVREWPEEAVEIFQSVGWIKPKEPAQTVVCPGCEENCFMPVHVRKRDDGVIHARVICDRLDYMGPVPIPLNYLKQWQITDHFLKIKRRKKSWPIIQDHISREKLKNLKG